MANPKPKGEKFTSPNQPAGKGRKRSVSGPLEKESRLSLDDIRKAYKNILTAKSFGRLAGLNGDSGTSAQLKLGLGSASRFGLKIKKPNSFCVETGNTPRPRGCWRVRLLLK